MLDHKVCEACWNKHRSYEGSGKFSLSVKFSSWVCAVSQISPDVSKNKVPPRDCPYIFEHAVVAGSSHSVE